MKKNVIICIVLTLFISACTSKAGSSSSSASASADTFAIYDYDTDHSTWIYETMINKYTDDDDFVNAISDSDAFEEDISDVLITIAAFITSGESEDPSTYKTLLEENNETWQENINNYNGTTFDYDTLSTVYDSLSSDSDFLSHTISEQDYAEYASTTSAITAGSGSYDAKYFVVYDILDSYLNSTDGEIITNLSYNDSDNFYIPLYECFGIRTQLETYSVADAIDDIIEDSEEIDTKLALILQEIEDLDEIDDSLSSSKWGTGYTLSTIKSEIDGYLDTLYSAYYSSAYSTSIAEGYFELSEDPYTTELLSTASTSASDDYTRLRDLFRIVFKGYDSSTQLSIREQLKIKLSDSGLTSNLEDVYEELTTLYYQIYDSDDIDGDSDYISNGNYSTYASIVLKVLEGVQLVEDNYTELKNNTITIDSDISS